MIVIDASALQVIPTANPGPLQTIKRTIIPRHMSVRTYPRLKPLSSSNINPPTTIRGSSKSWETHSSSTARLGTYVTPIIASTSNSTPKPSTLVSPASACWGTKVIPIQLTTRMMPLHNPTAFSMTLTSAVSVMILTLLM